MGRQTHKQMQLDNYNSQVNYIIPTGERANIIIRQCVQYLLSNRFPDERLGLPTCCIRKLEHGGGEVRMLLGISIHKCINNVTINDIIMLIQ